VAIRVVSAHPAAGARSRPVPSRQPRRPSSSCGVLFADRPEPDRVQSAVTAGPPANGEHVQPPVGGTASWPVLIALVASESR
jgi:hypothetical protein